MIFEYNGGRGGGRRSLPALQLSGGATWRVPMDYPDALILNINEYTYVSNTHLHFCMSCHFLSEESDIDFIEYLSN